MDEGTRDAINKRKRAIYSYNEQITHKGYQIQQMRKKIKRLKDEIFTLSELPRKQHEAK